MIVIVENQNLPRAERYTAFAQGIDGIRARLLSGPTAEIVIERLLCQEIQIEQEVIEPAHCWINLQTGEAGVITQPPERETLVAEGVRLTPEGWETLTPAQYAARYADRVPWKSPTGGVR